MDVVFINFLNLWNFIFTFYTVNHGRRLIERKVATHELNYHLSQILFLQ